MLRRYLWTMIACVCLISAACGEEPVSSEPAVEVVCDRETPYPDCSIDYLNIGSMEDVRQFCDDPCATVARVTLSLAPGLKNLAFLRGVKDIGGLVVISAPDLESLEGAEGLGPEVDVIGLESLPSLTSIEALRNVESVTRAINLRELPALASLHGLHSFRGLAPSAISPLTLYGVGGITDLSGLESIEEMDQGVVLQQNPKLTSLRGLHNARRLGGLGLVHNDTMREIDGLDSLRELDGLGITSNRELRSLDGLSQVETIHYLSITRNPRLPQCEVDALIARAVPEGEEVRTGDNDSSAACD